MEVETHDTPMQSPWDVITAFDWVGQKFEEADHKENKRLLCPSLNRKQLSHEFKGTLWFCTIKILITNVDERTENTSINILH